MQTQKNSFSWKLRKAFIQDMAEHTAMDEVVDVTIMYDNTNTT